MVPMIHQMKLSKVAADVLRKYMIVYLAWEERTGKSLTSILVAEQIAVQKILIVTKKNALGNNKEEKGWVNTLAKFEHRKDYTLTTYGKAKPGNYDLIIMDESHNYISSYPKPSVTWKKLKQVCKGVPIIYLSATPHAQGLQLLYHQFALSSWSPWKNEVNFYSWFKHYGKPYTIKLSNREVNQYDRVDSELIRSCVDHLFITRTRKELGFEFEPKDKVHYLELSDISKKLYNRALKNKILVINNIVKLLDTTITMRVSLHMLEGGVAKVTSHNRPKNRSEILQVDKEKVEGETLYHIHYDLCLTTEKINYILDTWGDTNQVAIMYNYIGEGIKLKRTFKQAKILQATSNAEGVELAHVEHLVIYSQDFSTARHTQRRARQASKNRTSPIYVHFLIIKKAVSEQVYKTVSINKVNYVDSRFEKELL